MIKKGMLPCNILNFVGRVGGQDCLWQKSGGAGSKAKQIPPVEGSGRLLPPREPNAVKKDKRRLRNQNIYTIYPNSSLSCSACSNSDFLGLG